VGLKQSFGPLLEASPTMKNQESSSSIQNLELSGGGFQGAGECPVGGVVYEALRRGVLGCQALCGLGFRVGCLGLRVMVPAVEG